eukprot:766748-Hanusia_phi.AAC.3
MAQPSFPPTRSTTTDTLPPFSWTLIDELLHEMLPGFVSNAEQVETLRRRQVARSSCANSAASKAKS